ncbi:MAG: hypothetical protein LBL65_02870 [Campylobacteraceae bacterium]|jgi:hypothetical protein|nr:hypothetical protein [Campylobacteraceae bacterium]
MYYENPQVPHEVNVSKESEIGSFLKMTVAIVAIVSVLFAAIYLLVRFFTPFMPYSVEVSLAENFIYFEQNANGLHEKAANELQKLALNLTKKMNVPNSIPLQVIIINDNEQNAFATLGEYIYL